MNKNFIVTRKAHCPITNNIVKDGINGIRMDAIEHGNYKIFDSELFKNNYELLVNCTRNNSNKIFNRKIELTETNDATYQIKMVIPFNEFKMFQLAIYNWQVEKINKSTITLISYKAVNLNALSKHIDGQKVNKIELIRIKDNTVTHKFNCLNMDVIKECQRLDTKKAITNRIDKPQKHVLSK